MKTYVVAWIATKNQNCDSTARLEVPFDCKGRFGVVQQIIPNNSKDSQYHSYDATAEFETLGALTRTIMPESFYEGDSL